jgi:hypothetical protein
VTAAPGDPAAPAPAPAPAGSGWSQAGLLIAFAAFLAIVVWLIMARPGPFRRAARIPLEDGRVVTPRGGRRGDGGSTEDA